MSQALENRKREGFETFRPVEPQAARYDDLKQPEVLTLEAIEREPWKAIALEVPADASRELLVGIAVAANIIGNECTREADESLTAPDTDYLYVMANEAKARHDLVESRLAALDAKERLTLEAIAREPWNAVTLELPADADRKLLARTAQAAQNEMVNAEGYLAVAASGEEEAYWGERIEKAALRIKDVQVRLGAAETLDQMQDRHRDQYELVLGAYGVEELPSQLAVQHDREFAAWPGKPAPEIEPDYAAHIEGPRDTNFLSPGFILRALTEHLARFVDLVLDVVIGFFVDEPKLTAAQVHDTLQARGNVETIHANEVAVATRENLAAHDWQSSMTISGQQEHDLMAAMTLGGNATAEAQLSEGYEPVRERRRSRHL